MGRPVYREPAPPEPTEAPPPTELIYAALDREVRKKSSVAAFQTFSVPPIVAVVLTLAVTPTAGLIGLILSAIALVWWWRRAPYAHKLILRVERGELSVHARGGREETLRVRLEDLENVALDTKTIQRVQDGASAIPAMRFIDSQVGPEVEQARIVLVARGRRARTTTPLGETYLAHMDAIEWLGKTRLFLRKHGWLPEDERVE